MIKSTQIPFWLPFRENEKVRFALVLFLWFRKAKQSPPLVLVWLQIIQRLYLVPTLEQAQHIPDRCVQEETVSPAAGAERPPELSRHYRSLVSASLMWPAVAQRWRATAARCLLLAHKYPPRSHQQLPTPWPGRPTEPSHHQYQLPCRRDASIDAHRPQQYRDQPYRDDSRHVPRGHLFVRP